VPGKLALTNHHSNESILSPDRTDKPRDELKHGTDGRSGVFAGRCFHHPDGQRHGHMLMLRQQSGQCARILRHKRP